MDITFAGRNRQLMFAASAQRKAPPRQFPGQMRLPLPTAPTAHLTADARLFTLEQRILLKGWHQRRRSPEPGHIYVAGVSLPPSGSGPTTITITEVLNPWSASPTLRIANHRRLGGDADVAIGRLRSMLQDQWRCEAAAINGPSGRPMGLNLAASSRESLLGDVEACPDLAMRLLAAVTAGRVNMYAEDASAESQDFWSQIIRARRRADEDHIEAYIEPTTGDDGYLASLALAVLAASHVREALAAVAPLATAA